MGDQALPGDANARRGTELTMEDTVIEAARQKYASALIQIDDDAKVSEAGNGTWVQAWVWVARPSGE